MSQNKQPNTQRKKRKKKWPWIVLAAVLVAGVALYFSASRQVRASITEEKAALRDIATYYSFSGNLTPVDDNVQTAKDGFKVKELYVAEGDKVAEGQALLRGADGTRVYAAHAGTIEELYPEVDDQLQPGGQIARIVNYDALEVSVDVDEYDIEAISMGKEGTVYINALDRSVPGTVSEIARNATTEGGVSYYAVKMQVDAGPDVRSGMSVEVNILNKQALGAVSVNLKTLSYDEYNKPFVYKKDAEGKLTAEYVETGVSDGQNIQILSGLSAGESVYYQTNDMARFFAMQQEMMDTRSAVMGSD